mgnify:CR=1 FL=1
MRLMFLPLLGIAIDDSEPKGEVDSPTIQYLFDGGVYDAGCKETLAYELRNLTAEERVSAFLILDALCRGTLIVMRVRIWLKTIFLKLPYT